MSNRIVFITTTNFCGSTMLGLILGSHSKCEFMGEFSKRSWIYGRLSGYEEAKRRNYCFFCDDCHVFETVKTYKDAFKYYPDKILIDTSKKPQWIDDHRRYDVKVIYLERSTEGIQRSYKKRGRHKKGLAKRIEKTLGKKAKHAAKYSHLNVTYVDICTEAGIKKCCDFIGIEFEPSMMRFWEKKHHGIGNKSLIAGIRNGTVKEIRCAD